MLEVLMVATSDVSAWQRFDTIRRRIRIQSSVKTKLLLKFSIGSHYSWEQGVPCSTSLVLFEAVREMFDRYRLKRFGLASGEWWCLCVISLSVAMVARYIMY